MPNLRAGTPVAPLPCPCSTDAPIMPSFMTSRRTFLQMGIGLAGAGLAQNAQATPDATPSTLPPSIANLKSMKEHVRPISVAERRERQEKARSLMRANDLDAILLMEGTSLNYFSGIRWWGGERMFAMVLPAKGEAFYMCPAFEEGRAREQIAKTSDNKQSDVRVWQEEESPYERMAQGLKDRGMLRGRSGSRRRCASSSARDVAGAAPQARLLSATPVTAGCRMIKSRAGNGLDATGLAGDVDGLSRCVQALRDGMTQVEVGSLIETAHDKLGFPGDALVEMGEYSAFPHGSMQPQVIREGDPC